MNDTPDTTTAWITNLATTVDLVFLDTETTGLNADTQRIWEIYAERHNAGGGVETIHLYPHHKAHDNFTQVPLPFIVDYHQRVPADIDRTDTATTAKILAQTLRQRGDNPPPVVVAANPTFDMNHIATYLDAGNQSDGSHYRRLDIEAAAYGHTRQLAIGRAGGLAALAEKYGIDPTGAHTAQGDVRMVKLLYEAIFTASH